MDICEAEGGHARTGKLEKRKERGCGVGRELSLPHPPTLPRKLLQGSLWGQVESCPPFSHRYCEHPNYPPLGERGHHPDHLGWGGDRGAVAQREGCPGGVGPFQPRAPAAARLGFVCRMDIVMSNECLTGDVICQPPSFSL